MRTIMEVISEMLWVGDPQMSQVLPCHFAFPIPALSAYQSQTALEQETTNEAIAQAQLELLSQDQGLEKQQTLGSPSAWQPAAEASFLAWNCYSVFWIWCWILKSIFLPLFSLPDVPSLMHPLNLTLTNPFWSCYSIELPDFFVWDSPGRYLGLCALCVSHLGRRLTQFQTASHPLHCGIAGGRRQNSPYPATQEHQGNDQSPQIPPAQSIQKTWNQARTTALLVSILL